MDAGLDVEREAVGHLRHDQRAVRLAAVIDGGERPAVERQRDQFEFVAVEAQRGAGACRLRVAAHRDMRGDTGVGLAEIEDEVDRVDQEVGRPVIGEPGRLRGGIGQGVGHGKIRSREAVLQLYTYYRSQASFRVRIALNLKGLKREDTFLHLEKGDQFAPALPRAQPADGGADLDRRRSEAVPVAGDP